MPKSRLDVATIATLVVVAAWAVSVGITNGNAVLAAVGVGQVATAYGVWRRWSWGYLSAGMFGVFQIGLATFVLVFSLGLSIPEGGDLGDPWLGVGFATLNGYASIVVLVAVIVLSVAMLAAAWRGLRHR